jgi:pyruvate dehydrogenase (quinone)
MATRVADVIVSTLTEAGAKRCYGIPGDTLNHVTDALSRSSIRFIHVRHEEVAGFAAGADALLSEELAVCAGSGGPGSLHFVNGLFESHRNRAPVVLIASQIVRDELGFAFPQEVDFKPIYSGASVFCEEIRTPASARRMTAMAAQAALANRGVSVLIVPADVAAAPAPDQPPFAVHRASPVTRPSDAELDRIAALVNDGARIAIYGGSGCAGAHDEVVALAAHLNAPVAYTSRAKDFLEYENPFAVGLTGLFGVESGYHALKTCDTLLLLGCDFAWRQFYPDKARIVQIDIDGRHLGRRHPVDCAAVGDIAPTIHSLIPRLRRSDDARFLEEVLELRDRAYAGIGARAKAGSSGRIHPQFLTETLAAHAPEDAIWSADGGSPMIWLLRHVPSTGKNRTLLSMTHGTMANAMPQALGAQAAFPGRMVISLSGDGGLSMLLGDLLTAVQENLPIKVVVFNNGSLATAAFEQKVEGFLDHYTDLVNPDFAKVAEAIGFWSRRVSDPYDVPAVVKAFLETPGPALLDVVIDKFELLTPGHIELPHVFGTALYSAKALLTGRVGEVAALVGHAYRS